ncbi:MAG: GAF domain-containing protein [Lachnospiraceae bacterium]|jgi:HD-GYP domain-containing protein (c-di-GMP phosphodiesterase class II)|nr:GAF domain-containing protein [Lachnospiraceae bacterium]
MNQKHIEQILKIGVQLSAERDLNRLLEQLLTCVMELSHCDAGTLYLLDGDVLRFKIMRNHTMGVYSGGDGKEPDMAPVPLKRENMCAMALLERRTISIANVKESQEYDFSGPIRYDAVTGYHTQSMLAVPMCNREGEKLGVLQLINAMDDAGNIRPFPDEMTLVLESVASQAAITIQNVRYIQAIKELFYSFVRVMSSAVDERSPYNGNHTRHMAAYGDRFLDYLNQKAADAGKKPPFPSAEREELLMSVWLHDIGKLVIPLEIMDKPARLLPDQHTAFLHRMEILRLQSEIDRLSGRLTDSGQEALIQKTQEAEALVEEVNITGFLSDEKLEALARLAALTYTDRDNQTKPWLTPEEYAMLSIRKGTLSEEERSIMESHVSVTEKLLSQIQLSHDFSHVKEWASGHHELLNGSGYPRHLAGREIPTEVRIITILDIFDALTADDRPYKPGMPVERALSVLKTMAEKEGKLDPELVRLFTESRCWEYRQTAI